MAFHSLVGRSAENAAQLSPAQWRQICQVGRGGGANGDSGPLWLAAHCQRPIVRSISCRLPIP